MAQINMTVEDRLKNKTHLPKTVNSEKDFIAIECSESDHGLYYKTVKEIKVGDTECPRCQFLNPSRMFKILTEAQDEIKKDLSWLHFWNHNKRDLEYLYSQGLFYRILVTHKQTGYMFQKIGVIELIEESFNEKWDPYKWKDFSIEAIDKIECNLLEASTIEALFQKYNTHLKITVPNYLKFNTNKTYEPDFIWQAKSKTIKSIRDAYLLRQKQMCPVCGRAVEKPTLDHVHQKKVKGTGLIRGTICSQCNVWIAKIENNVGRYSLDIKDLPNTLRRVADHLEQEKQIIHPTEIPKREKVKVRAWNKVKKYYFKLYPRRKALPKSPTYITDKWLELVREVDEYQANLELEKLEKLEKLKRIKE